MKGLKFAVAVIGVIGLVAVFLPYVSEGGLKLSFWKTAGLANVKVQAYIAIVGFALAAVMGILAAAKGGLSRMHAIVALIGFALCFAAGGVRDGYKSGGAIGAKLLFFAAVIGLIVAIIGAAKPEQS